MLPALKPGTIGLLTPGGATTSIWRKRNPKACVALWVPVIAGMMRVVRALPDQTEAFILIMEFQYRGKAR